jgi:hypothetical protein
MPYNFLRCDRDQPFLLPPDLRDWLPNDHLVLTANRAPDHVTVARFRARHQTALAGFLVESLKLCAAAGMVRLGVVALDGTKVAANAADRASRTLPKLEDEVAQMLQEAAEADQRENGQHGPARGDELPAQLASPTGRLARLQEAKALLEADAAQRQPRYQQRVAELAAAARAKGKQPRAHIKPRRRDEAPKPQATTNTTDPDSRLMHTRNGWVQGYNAQQCRRRAHHRRRLPVEQRLPHARQQRPLIGGHVDGGANHVSGRGACRRQARREVAQALARLRDRVAASDQLTTLVQRHLPGDEHQLRLAHRGQVRVAGRLGQAWHVPPLDRHGALRYQGGQQPFPRL